MSLSPYRTEQEAVQFLRLESYKKPVEILQRLCRKKKLKSVKRGRDYLFLEKWLDAYLTGKPV